MRPKLLLPLLVLAQFAGTSLWFAGNAILGDIQLVLLAENAANVTAAVQFGFIAGTLIFAVFNVADRFPSPFLFFISSLIAALANLILIWTASDIHLLYLFRFITGFFLAGIYPVGMKIAADLFPKKLGKAMGFLVGSLVLGTAFPHLLRANKDLFQWQYVLFATSIMAVLGGLAVLLFIPSQLNKRSTSRFSMQTAFRVFKLSNFRAAALGYFGHMWELYTFWAFLPLLLVAFTDANSLGLNVSLWSFYIIAIGGIGCIIGGIFSMKWGSKKVAAYALAISGICCLSMLFLFELPLLLFLIILLVWGLTVVADSPQFSTLVAQSAPVENKGTALTIVTSIGFAITIISLQFVKFLYDYLNEHSLVVLALGPLVGLVAFRKYKQKKN